MHQTSCILQQLTSIGFRVSIYLWVCLCKAVIQHTHDPHLHVHWYYRTEEEHRMEADVSFQRRSCSMLTHPLQGLPQQIVGPRPAVPIRCSQLLDKLLECIQHLVLRMYTCQMVGIVSLRMPSTMPIQLLAAGEHRCQTTDLDASFNTVN